MAETDNHTFTCVVSCKGATYNFSATALFHESLQTHNIPASFYEDDNMPVPNGAHHELLLGDSWLTRQTDSDSTWHVYRHADGERCFVCFTGQIETIGQAEALFKQWCLGTVYTVLTKKDFAPLFEKEADPEAYLKAGFGIEMA